MKKYFNFSVLMVALAALCIGFNSCDKDNGGNESGGSPVGVWTFDKIDSEIEHPSNPDLVEEEKADIEQSSEEVSGVTIEFKEDNSYVLKVEGEDEEEDDRYLWKANGDINFAGDEGKFSIKGNVLTITVDYIDGDRMHEEEVHGTYRKRGFSKYIMKYIFKK
jgi:hypothetical protein